MTTEETLAEIRRVRAQGADLTNLLWLRDKIPWLLGEIERLQAENDRITENAQHDAWERDERS